MKYIKYSFLAALGFLFAQCTEEGDKTYPQQPAPQWSVVEEDFLSEAPTWQVRDMAIIGVKGQPTTAIGNVTAGTQGKFNPTLPYTVYDISGRVVAGDAQHGVFIVKQGNNTFKVMR